MKQIPCEDESTIDDLPKSFLLNTTGSALLVK